jgi:hypothetical protein
MAMSTRNPKLAQPALARQEQTMLRTPEGMIVGGIGMLLFVGWLVFSQVARLSLIPLIFLVIGLIVLVSGLRKLREDKDVIGIEIERAYTCVL